jgi:hypothetical protein
MQLTAICSPFMATLIGLFFTFSPKHMLVWKGVFCKVFKARAKVGHPGIKNKKNADISNTASKPGCRAPL